MNERSRDMLLCSIIRKLDAEEYMDDVEYALYERVLQGG